jgi:hypothetical protein
MSGYLSKLLFKNNSKSFFIQLKPLCTKPSVNFNNRLLRNTIKRNDIIVNKFEIGCFKIQRNYVRLYNREHQLPGNVKSNQIPLQTIPETMVVNEAEQQLGIFKRFKDAYKKHGKVLIICHVTTCIGWVIGLYLLAER